MRSLTALGILLSVCAFVHAQEAVPGIETVALPESPVDRSNVLVISAITLSGITLTQEFTDEVTDCLEEELILEDGLMESLFLYNASQPVEGSTAEGFSLYGLQYWSELAPADFGEYRETFIKYVDLNGGLLECLGTGGENSDVAVRVAEMPTQLDTLDETASIPFWAIYIISAILSLAFLGIIFYMIFKNSKKQVYDESQYVEYVDVQQEPSKSS